MIYLLSSIDSVSLRNRGKEDNVAIKADDSCIKMTHGYYNQSIEIPCIEVQRVSFQNLLYNDRNANHKRTHDENADVTHNNSDINYERYGKIFVP